MRESSLCQALQEKTPVPLLGSDGNWPQWSHPEGPVCKSLFWDPNLFHFAPFSEGSFYYSRRRPVSPWSLLSWRYSVDGDMQSHPTKNPGCSCGWGAALSILHRKRQWPFAITVAICSQNTPGIFCWKSKFGPRQYNFTIWPMGRTVIGNLQRHSVRQIGN